MTGLLKRVTLAMLRARHPGLDDAAFEDGHYWWGLSVDEVRAVLAAMREPTFEMLKAGRPFVAKAFPTLDGAWGAMIDAAIAEMEQEQARME